MHDPLPVQPEPLAQYLEKQVLTLTQAAHEQAWQLLEEISAFLKPGITEAEAVEFAHNAAKRLSIEKNWHKPYIYFGSHTLLTAHDPRPSDSLILQEEDIAYVDIGPVINVNGLEIEGDVGQTFVVGSNPLFHQLKSASEHIFQQARLYWKEQNPSGVGLYQYIEQLAHQVGFKLNMEPAGHLIGSFPHSGWRDGLNHYPFPVDAGLWILEIQLRHPTEPYGAFYEAVLL